MELEDITGNSGPEDSEAVGRQRERMYEKLPQMSLQFSGTFEGQFTGRTCPNSWIAVVVIVDISATSSLDSGWYSCNELMLLSTLWMKLLLLLVRMLRIPGKSYRHQLWCHLLLQHLLLLIVPMSLHFGLLNIATLRYHVLRLLLWLLLKGHRRKSCIDQIRHLVPIQFDPWFPFCYQGREWSSEEKSCQISQHIEHHEQYSWMETLSINFFYSKNVLL